VRLLIEKRWRSIPRPATLHSHSGLYNINPQRSTVEESSTSTDKQFRRLSNRSLATRLPLQDPTSSPSQPKPPMASESYLAKCPNQIGAYFNTTGMSGWVCATPARPGTLDITNCCSGKYRVQGNCIQICESRSDLVFGECVNSGVGKNGSGFHAALCINTSANLADEPSSSSSSSGDGGNTGEESGAGEFIHVSLWRLRSYELTDMIFQLRGRAGRRWVTRSCFLLYLLSLSAWLLTSSPPGGHSRLGFCLCLRTEQVWYPSRQKWKRLQDLAKMSVEVRFILIFPANPRAHLDDKCQNAIRRLGVIRLGRCKAVGLV
jgi:hypothetical protein